jgi:NCS1 family nucleobase:cation symporter-1
VSQADFSRFARKPGDQVVGQWVSFVTLGTIVPLFGCLAGSATAKIYGAPAWSPPMIILTWLQVDYTPVTRAAAFFAGLGMVLNLIGANVVESGELYPTGVLYIAH